jgi:hypothetical protein
MMRSEEESSGYGFPSPPTDDILCLLRSVETAKHVSRYLGRPNMFHGGKELPSEAGWNGRGPAAD